MPAPIYRRRTSRAPAKRMSCFAWAALGLWFGSSALGCAGHSAKTKDARDALDQGNPAKALALYNEQLKVKSGKELPASLKGDTSLFVLDRSMIQQSLGDFPNSSRDLEVADKQLEILDFSRSALDDVGKYLFSDDSGEYRAPPFEKLLINTMNMVNYLSRHDLSGAKVEARRLAVMQQYFRSSKTPEASASIAPGSYFAGFSFEKSGRGDIAIRYYDETLQAAALPSLVEPVRRLVSETGYKGANTTRFLAMADAAGGNIADKVAMAPSETQEIAAGVNPDELAGASTDLPPVATAIENGEVLAIVSYGRTPAKIAKRIPIGLALTYGALFLSAAQVTQANQLAAKGLVMWVNYPELDPPGRKLTRPSVTIDGKAYTVEETIDVEAEARKAYESVKGRIIASAVIRMIARALAGEAAQQASSDSTVGLLLNLGTQATLTSLDTPDTRSWSTLPARIGIVRVSLPPGKHRIEMQAQGAKKVQEINLTAGRWEAVSLTALR